MNIQDNAQRSSDYYKELKTVRKEIDKIYKLLTIDETFPEIINKIQNDLSKTITFILTNLSKPKSSYKELNTKIMKIIYLLIQTLTYFAVNVIISESIEEYLNKNPFDSNKSIDENIELKNSSFSSSDKPTTSIMKIILILRYYHELLEKNIFTKENTDIIRSIEERIKVEKSKGVPDEKILEKLNQSLEDKKTEADKGKYIEVLNYIQVTSFEIFEYVDSNYTTKLKEKEKEVKSKKSVEQNEANKFVDKFKKDIYYNFIANNSSGIDSESQLFENGNEKVELEARKDLLVKMKEQLDKQLNNLNGIIQFLIDSSKQEYLKEIKDLQKEFKDYVKEKEYSDNILTILVNEEGELKKQLDKNALNKKILTEKAEQDRMKLQRDIDIGTRAGPRGGRRNNKMFGGEQKTGKHYEDKYKSLKDLLTAIDSLIKKIAEIEGKEDDKDPFSKKNGMFGDADNDFNSIYNNIWKDYKKEMNKIKSKGVTLESLKQDNRLYERVKENNLDPQDVLKITFQDKVIFICIILIIRTFAMVLIELLIEYNIVSTLNRGILVYSIIYLLLLLTGVLIINYDSYKLRILVNYLNIHINSSNIFFHALLFCLFIGLILIIINDEDNSLKSIDNIFNYTYVYKYIYEIAEKSNPMSHLLLSQKEKLKLQYRMDIITMIIFIFSSLLILIM
jgi:hypothetical protein